MAGRKVASRRLHSSGVTVPDISVIVPHYNDPVSLGRCLTALDQQSAIDRWNVEVIVADNNSPGGLEAIAALVGARGRVVSSMIKGAGPARNAGIAAAKGKYLAFTDCDCRPDEHWLLEGFKALSDCDLVGVRMIVLRAAAGPMSGAEAFERVFAFQNERYVKKKGFTVTANLFCERNIALAIGNFRAEVSEDLEWCQRARQLGFQLGYAGKAIVGHPARKDWHELKRKWQRLNRESYSLHAQNGRGIALWLSKTWLLPVSIVPHTAKVMASKELPLFSQRLSALLTLLRLRLWRF